MENTLDKKYTDLLQKILTEGVVKKDRTGTGTKSIFGYQIRHNMKEGFPLLTTKKMAWKSMVVELIWFLRGDTNIKFLVDNGCNIWVGDAYKNYLKNPTYKAENVAQMHQSQAGQLIECPTEEEFIEKIKTDEAFAKKWGELGPVYGKQWRSWETPEKCDSGDLFEWPNDDRLQWPKIVYISIDQIKNSIDMLRNDPDSRRNIVSAWNVADINKMVLPPCHNFFQFYTRELSYQERCEISHIGLHSEDLSDEGHEYHHMKYMDEFNVPKRAVSLMWNQRSVDSFLGLPFNIASYGLLLEIVAKEVNMVPEELIGNLGDTHLYLNHLEQAEEQIGRELDQTNRRLIWEEQNPSISMSWHHMENADIDGFLDENEIPRRTREPMSLPRVEINDSWKFSSKSPFFADTIELHMIKLVDYKSHPAIKAPLSN